MLFSLYLYISGTDTTNIVSSDLSDISYAAGGVAAAGEEKIPGKRGTALNLVGGPEATLLAVIEGTAIGIAAPT